MSCYTTITTAKTSFRLRLVQCKNIFSFLFFSLSPASLLSSSFFLFQSSILIRPASLLSPLLRSSASTTPHCPALIEAQPSADHSSLPIADRSLASPLLRSSAPTTPHCPAPTEVQPSANHSLRSPPQRPNLRAPPSLCYLMPSADVGFCLCFPICCGQVGLCLCLW